MNHEISGKKPLETRSTTKEITTENKRRRTEDFVCNPPGSLQSKEISSAEAAAQQFVNELSVSDSETLFKFRVQRQSSDQWHISDTYLQGSQLNREYLSILSGHKIYIPQEQKSVDRKDNQSPEDIIRQYIINNPIDPKQFETERTTVINHYNDFSKTTTFSKESEMLLCNIKTNPFQIFKTLLDWQTLTKRDASDYMKQAFANAVIKTLESKNGLPIGAIHAITKKSILDLTHGSAILPSLTINALEGSPFSTAAHLHKE